MYYERKRTDNSNVTGQKGRGHKLLHKKSPNEATRTLRGKQRRVEKEGDTRPTEDKVYASSCLPAWHVKLACTTSIFTYIGY